MATFDQFVASLEAEFGKTGMLINSDKTID